eukprot:scaffold87442_cov96-Phaeocystis_antarctica.AAC.1
MSSHSRAAAQTHVWVISCVGWGMVAEATAQREVAPRARTHPRHVEPSEIARAFANSILSGLKGGTGGGDGGEGGGD